MSYETWAVWNKVNDLEDELFLTSLETPEQTKARHARVEEARVLEEKEELHRLMVERRCHSQEERMEKLALKKAVRKEERRINEGFVKGVKAKDRRDKVLEPVFAVAFNYYIPLLVTTVGIGLLLALFN